MPDKILTQYELEARISAGLEPLIEDVRDDAALFRKGNWPAGSYRDRARRAAIEAQRQMDRGQGVVTDKPPIVSGVLAYFPGAIIEVAKVSAAGNKQHGTKSWDRSKSTDELNALGRHLLAHLRGELRDTDAQYHLAKVAWRALAALERLLDA